MSKTLFQIEESMYNLINYGCDDDGVILSEEEFNELYQSIQMDLITKLDNSNSVTKLIDGELEVIDKEIKRLQSLKKDRTNKKEWLIRNIDGFIKRQFTDENGVLDTESLHKYKLDLPHGKISYRKSNSVEVTDVDKIPNEYVNVVVERKPDKKEIKKAIDSGKNIEGAKVVTNYNLSLK